MFGHTHCALGVEVLCYASVGGCLDSHSAEFEVFMYLQVDVWIPAQCCRWWCVVCVSVGVWTRAHSAVGDGVLYVYQWVFGHVHTVLSVMVCCMCISGCLDTCTQCCRWWCVVCVSVGVWTRAHSAVGDGVLYVYQWVFGHVHTVLWVVGCTLCTNVNYKLLWGAYWKVLFVNKNICTISNQENVYKNSCSSGWVFVCLCTRACVCVCVCARLAYTFFDVSLSTFIS